MTTTLRAVSMRFAACCTICLVLAPPMRAEAQNLSVTSRTLTQKSKTPHVAGAAVYDTKRGRVIMFANHALRNKDQKPGLTAYCPVRDDFVVISTVGASPAGVGYPSMVYDPTRDALYLFGGWKLDAAGPMGELWTLKLGDDGPKSWQKIGDANASPPARNGSAMVIDHSRDRLILSGGDGGPHPRFGYTPLDDLWSYDLAGGGWKKLNATGVSPGPRWNQSVAIDQAAGKMYVFGGTGYTPDSQLIRDSDLFTLDLQNLKWTRARCKGECPDPVQGATLTFDEGAKALVLVGGLRSSDAGSSGTTSVWVYDLGVSNWVETKDVDRRLRRAHTAVYDPVRKQHVVHGGQTAKVRQDHYKRGEPLYDTILLSIGSEE